MVPTELKLLTDSFFDAHAHEYDMATNEGCGRYIEALVPYAQNNGYPKVGHLRKNPAQTQYNGHANDAILYNEPEGPDNLLQSIDLIARAEQPHPWISEGGTNPDPGKNFGVDIPRYKESDWIQSVESEQPPDEGDTVPWQPYWGDLNSDEITRTIFFDYSRKPESANFGMGRWISRMIHSAVLGPEGVPLGIDGALARHRPELCAALGGLDPNVPVPASFQGVCDGEWK